MPKYEFGIANKNIFKEKRIVTTFSWSPVNHHDIYPKKILLSLSKLRMKKSHQIKNVKLQESLQKNNKWELRGHREGKRC